MIISLVLLLYSVKTFKRNLDWKDSLSLAESAVPVNPTNAKVFMTIGNHYAQKVRVNVTMCTHRHLRIRSVLMLEADLGLVYLVVL